MLGIMVISAAGSMAGAQETTSDSASESPEVVRLLDALRRYREIAATGGWPAIPPGPTIRPGSRDPRIRALIERLEVVGDLQTSGAANIDYDEDLQSAVRDFQSRHGLEPDALVGPATLRALNVSARERVQQLERNLPRARDVFTQTRKNFVLVNVPAFEAYLYRDGDMVWKTGVVVGHAETETPLLESDVRSVVLNPTWTVPRSIASEELLPKIQADVDFLSRGDYDVLDADRQIVDPTSINWEELTANNFPYTLVQRPGPNNELGRIKFLFPNEYSVCMHDTPSKYLFSHYSRAFSHGCIRVEQPVDLAIRLLAEEGVSRDHINASLSTVETEIVKLADPVPIVLAYLTATVDHTGSVHFLRDIYDSDAPDAGGAGSAVER